MAHLAGRFVGILKLSVPEEKATGLSEALGELVRQGLDVSVGEGLSEGEVSGERALRLEIVGNDREGIVHDVSSVIVAQGGNVEELNTECVEAPHTGGTLFKATILVRCAASVSIDELRRGLEELAGELLLDVSNQLDG